MQQCGSLEKEIILGTSPGQRHRGIPRMSWWDSITPWTVNVRKDTEEYGEGQSISGQSLDGGRLKTRQGKARYRAERRDLLLN